MNQTIKRTDDATLKNCALPNDGTFWFGPKFLLCLIGFIILGTYPHVVFGTQSFFYRDFGLFSHPAAVYQRNSLWQLTIPLWNPLSNCGIPFLAQWNTMALYPLSLICVLLPMPWSLNIFCLGHLLLAGLGMYFLARQWTGNRMAACLAGVAFAWNGLSVHSIMWTSNLAALAWMPWVVLYVEKAWQEGGKKVMVAALIGGLQMLTGSPEIILFTWVILAVLLAIQMWRPQSSRVSLLMRFLTAGGLVACLTAAQILPFLDLLLHSQRNSSYASNNAWAMPGWGWANFIVPLFHCTPAIIGVYSQDEQQWTSSYYMGIGVLALAVFGALRSRRPRVYVLSAFAVAGVVLAMGENAPLYKTLKQALPLLGVMRYPIKMVVLTVFALPLLAAFGVARYESKSPDDTRSNLILGIVGCLILGILFCVVWMGWHHPHPGESSMVTLKNGITRGMFLVLILGSVFLMAKKQGEKAGIMAGCLLLLLAGFDAITHAPQQNPTVPLRAYGEIGLAQTVKARVGESRAMLSPQGYAFLSHAAVSDSFEYFTGFRRALFPNCNIPDRIPTVDGFFSIYVKEAARLNKLLYDPNSPLKENLADFVAASQISSSSNVFAWVDRGSSMPVVSAGQKPSFSNDENTLAILKSDKWDPRKTVYLPPEAQSAVQVTNESKVNLRHIDFTAQKITIQAEAQEKAMIVLAQTFYHPWHAFIDGKPAPLWRANYAFQAVEIPSGNHQVQLVYEDQAFKAGAVISVLALIFCLGGVLVTSRKTAFEED